MTMPITKERIAAIVRLETVVSQSHMRARKLQSILGKLSFAAKVLPAGKAFYARGNRAVHANRATVTITDALKADFQWWLSILPT